MAPKSVEQSLSLSNETLEAVRAANADDAQLYALAQSLAADDARCLSGHTARPKHAAAILQLVRNGTATNLVTISDDESGLPAFKWCPVWSRKTELAQSEARITGRETVPCLHPRNRARTTRPRRRAAPGVHGGCLLYTSPSPRD